jgi:hypothetical protein
MATLHETQVWATSQVLAWLQHHLDDGHDVRLPSPDTEDDRSSGVFACSCGERIEARPVVASDPAAGLYAVTGATPLIPPKVVSLQPAVVQTTPETTDDLPPAPRATVSLHRAHRRVRVSVGQRGVVEFDSAGTRKFANVLLKAADDLEVKE